MVSVQTKINESKDYCLRNFRDKKVLKKFAAKYNELLTYDEAEFLTWYTESIVARSQSYLVTPDFLDVVLGELDELTQRPFEFQASSFFTPAGCLFYYPPPVWRNRDSSTSRCLIATCWQLDFKMQSGCVISTVMDEVPYPLDKELLLGNAFAYPHDKFEFNCNEEMDWLLGDSSAEIINVGLASLLLMNERIASVTKLPTPKKALKKSARRARDYYVLDLRRPENNSVPKGTFVDWQQRWLVRGHWRRQPTASGIKHKWIAPYIKGPADKPFIHKDRLIKVAQ